MSGDERWHFAETPWDAGTSPPALLEWLDQRAALSGRALVPGAGKGHDVITLAKAGYQATGLDIAETARARFVELRDQSGLGGDRAELRVADFFAFDPEEPFDLSFDYTFLCALLPDQRAAWAESTARLIRPGGTLLALLFPVDAERPTDQGPPFALEPKRISALIESDFELVSLEPVRLSHPARAGREWLAEYRRR
jgi:SAM-dependent methyltransferase